MCLQQVRRFQFLMVRLKDYMSKINPIKFNISIPYGSIKSTDKLEQQNNKNISIPYGSIKSVLLYASVKKNLISIPYGSIKRSVQCYDIQQGTKFQFLMVRLKVKESRTECSSKQDFNSLWFD